MLGSVYCVKCRDTIEETDTFCKHCGADQRPPSRRTNTVHNPSSDTVPMLIDPAKASPNADPELEELKREVETEAKYRPRLVLLGHRLITTEGDNQFIIGIVRNDAYEECLEAEIGINVDMASDFL